MSVGGGACKSTPAVGDHPGGSPGVITTSSKFVLRGVLVFWLLLTVGRSGVPEFLSFSHGFVLLWCLLGFRSNLGSVFLWLLFVCWVLSAVVGVVSLSVWYVLFLCASAAFVWSLA